MCRKRNFIIAILAVSMLLTVANVSQAASELEKETAIANGLAWLAGQQNGNGSWTYSGSPDTDVAATGAALLAFIEEGHTPTSATAYSSNVVSGLNYLFANAQTVDITVPVTPAGDPDTNGNGIGLVIDRIGSRRFGNWLSHARDWAISRNRYWGSCIPVWECTECPDQECIGSIDELAERSGTRLDDLHKHIVDEVTMPCEACGGTMHRVPEVLDVWFESGAMPYGQHHYPFKDPEVFERNFPADFIAEGLDQTRGWFYTLLILSTGIFDQAPFQNCVVTGMVLAEDGRKMSKSLRNYPDPLHVLDEFGAALVAIILTDPFKFFPDNLHNQSIIGKHFFQPDYFFKNFFTVLYYLVSLESGQALQTHIKNSLSLDLGELKTADKFRLGLRRICRSLDQID